MTQRAVVRGRREDRVIEAIIILLLFGTPSDGQLLELGREPRDAGPSLTGEQCKRGAAVGAKAIRDPGQQSASGPRARRWPGSRDAM